MADAGDSRVVVMYPVTDARWRLNGESGDCLLRLGDGSHRIGYRDADGTWYEDGGSPIDPVEYGVL